MRGLLRTIEPQLPPLAPTSANASLPSAQEPLPPLLLPPRRPRERGYSLGSLLKSFPPFHDDKDHRTPILEWAVVTSFSPYFSILVTLQNLLGELLKQTKVLGAALRDSAEKPRLWYFLEKLPR